MGPPSQRSFKQGGDDQFLPKAIALFDFEVEGDNEISLKVCVYLLVYASYASFMQSWVYSTVIKTPG